MNVNGKAFPVSDEAWLVIGCLKTAGATAVYIVGGSVRNFFMGRPIKDYDLEIYGLTPEQIKSAVSHLGSISEVGTHFKVIKLRTSPKVEFDLAVPRREWKTGPMHVDFHVEIDPKMTTFEAAARRDFTVNSGMYDPVTDTLVDHYGFVHDVEHRILRPTSNQFEADPLRVLRGMWLAGMGLTMPARYNAMMANLAKYYPTISRERVWEEWEKWAGRSDIPSAGIEFLLSAGWLGIYPEVNEMIGCPQEPKHHPEGSTFIHSMMSLDYMTGVIFPREGIVKESETHISLNMTMLLHDSAKPQTTYRDPENGEIKSPGHDQMGANIMVPRFMEKIGRVNPDQKKSDPLVDMIQILVKNHMRHIGLQNPTRKNVRNLALDVGNLKYLSYVIEADNSARFPKPAGLPPQMKAIMDIAAEIELEQKKPVPILTGEILIKLGMVPGIAIGKMIRESFNAQMDEEFSDMFGAIAWAKKKLDSA